MIKKNIKLLSNIESKIIPKPAQNIYDYEPSDDEMPDSHDVKRHLTDFTVDELSVLPAELLEWITKTTENAHNKRAGPSEPVIREPTEEQIHHSTTLNHNNEGTNSNAPINGSEWSDSDLSSSKF